MKEKVTGLEWHDFVGLNMGLTNLIKDYQAFIDNGSPISDYWAGEIVKLKATLKKVNENRSYER